MKKRLTLVIMLTALCCSHLSVASDRQDVDVWKRANAKQGKKTVSTKANSGMQSINNSTLIRTEEKATVTADCDWTGLTPMAQRQMVRAYAAVFDLFAKESVPYGGDTESLWVADTVHTLAQQIQTEYLSYEDCLAKINVMQSCVGYGLAYMPALMATSAQTSMGIKGSTFLDVVQGNVDESNSMYEKVARQAYPDVKRLSAMSFSSWKNFITSYLCWNVLGKEEVYSSELTDASNKVVRTMTACADSIMALPYSKKTKFRAMFLLEANACMSALSPLCFALIGTEKEYRVDVRLLKDFYDVYLPLEVKAKDGSIQEFTDEEFEEVALYFSNLKVLFLKRLTSKLERYNELDELDAERTDEEMWEETVQENTLEAYDKYIKFTQRQTHLKEAFAARKRLNNVK